MAPIDSTDTETAHSAQNLDAPSAHHRPTQPSGRARAMKQATPTSSSKPRVSTDITQKVAGKATASYRRSDVDAQSVLSLTPSQLDRALMDMLNISPDVTGVRKFWLGKLYIKTLFGCHITLIRGADGTR